MSLPSALLPVVILATLICTPLGLAAGADAIGKDQVIDLVNAAKHISFGNPQTVTLTIAGRSVAFTVAVDTLGAITAVPVVADRAVKQISIGVITTNAGVVPNAVTVITGDSQVIGYSVNLAPDGTILALAPGGPLSVPPVHVASSEGRGEVGQLAPGPGGGAGGTGGSTSPGSDLVEGTPPLSLGTASPGGGVVYAPGTGPFQTVSPH